MKGTIQTDTEIITTEGREHIRELQKLGDSKIQKTKYTHGYRFIEEIGAKEVLRAVLGITSDAAAKPIVDQMGKPGLPSLPKGWKEMFSTLTLTAELEKDRLTIGLLQGFMAVDKKIKSFDDVKVKIKNFLATHGIVFEDWTQSMQDFFAYSVYARIPIVKVSTSENDEPVLEFYMRPEMLMETDKILIIWNNDVLFDKQQKICRHNRYTLPGNLKTLLETAEADGTMIRKIGDISVPYLKPAVAMTAVLPLVAPLPLESQEEAKAEEAKAVEEAEAEAEEAKAEAVGDFEPAGPLPEEQKAAEQIDLSEQASSETAEFEPANALAANIAERERIELPLAPPEGEAEQPVQPAAPAEEAAVAPAEEAAANLVNASAEEAPAANLVNAPAEEAAANLVNASAEEAPAAPAAQAPVAPAEEVASNLVNSSAAQATNAAQAPAAQAPAAQPPNAALPEI